MRAPPLSPNPNPNPNPKPKPNPNQGAGGGYSETIVDLSSWSSALEPGEVVRIA